MALGFWIIKFCVLTVTPCVCLFIQPHPLIWYLCVTCVSLSLVFDWAYPCVIESHPGFCGYVHDSQVWVSMVSVDVRWWWCKSFFQWLWVNIKGAWEWDDALACECSVTLHHWSQFQGMSSLKQNTFIECTLKSVLFVASPLPPDNGTACCQAVNIPVWWPMTTILLCAVVCVWDPNSQTIQCG